MKRVLSLLLILTIVLSCSKDTVTPSPTPEPTPKYSLVIAASEGGSVNSTGGTYDKGTKVTVTATPDGEYLFDSWSDGSTENPREITVTSNLDLTANFIKKKYSLIISTSGEGTVTEEVLVQGSVSDYNSGTKVRLTAVPNTDEDWEFIGWEGDVESTNPIIEIDVTEAKTVEAKFMRYFNYMVPSHDWENYYQEWFDLAGITDSLGFSKGDSYNTNAAYADFNFDGYLDIMIQPNVNDGVPVDSFFLINTGEDEFYIDNDFPLTQNVEVISSRKTIVGDFNNDGKPDVVRPQGGHDWLGKPQITISSETGYEIRLIGDGPEIQPHTIASGDIDNDGDLDIFFAQAGEQDGFLINEGQANFTWKWISEIITDFDRGHQYPDGGFGYYGFWSSEITDVDKDGYVDLILGGSYRDQSYDAGFDGPTILWGNGSGNYTIENSTTLFNWKELDYDGDTQISLSHDYAVNDVDGDGINDIAIFSECSDVWLYHIVQGQGNRNFVDQSGVWLDDNLIYNSSNHVWINLRDIDNNGLMDIVEGEPMISVPTQYSATGWRGSVRWEWNGNGFTKIN